MKEDSPDASFPLRMMKSSPSDSQFTDGFSIQGYVFTATGCIGQPQETSEAIPLWTPIDEIPFDRMWEDDRVWIPHMLAFRKFRGRFLFDGDHMLGEELEVEGLPT